MSNYNMTKSSNTAMQGKPKFSAMLSTQGFQQALANSLKSPKEIQKFSYIYSLFVSFLPNICIKLSNY